MTANEYLKLPDHLRRWAKEFNWNEDDLFLVRTHWQLGMGFLAEHLTKHNEDEIYTLIKHWRC